MEKFYNNYVINEGGLAGLSKEEEFEAFRELRNSFIHLIGGGGIGFEIKWSYDFKEEDENRD